MSIEVLFCLFKSSSLLELADGICPLSNYIMWYSLRRDEFNWLIETKTRNFRWNLVFGFSHRSGQWKEHFYVLEYFPFDDSFQMSLLLSFLDFIIAFCFGIFLDFDGNYVWVGKLVFLKIDLKQKNSLTL